MTALPASPDLLLAADSSSAEDAEQLWLRAAQAGDVAAFEKSCAVMKSDF